MNSLLQDLRYGARMLLKKPGFTLIAVLTLLLGIGESSRIFGVIAAALVCTFPLTGLRGREQFSRNARRTMR